MNYDPHFPNPKLKLVCIEWFFRMPVAIIIVWKKSFGYCILKFGEMLERKAFRRNYLWWIWSTSRLNSRSWFFAFGWLSSCPESTDGLIFEIGRCGWSFCGDKSSEMIVCIAPTDLFLWNGSRRSKRWSPTVSSRWFSFKLIFDLSFPIIFAGNRTVIETYRYRHPLFSSTLKLHLSSKAKIWFNLCFEKKVLQKIMVPWTFLGEGSSLNTFWNVIEPVPRSESGSHSNELFIFIFRCYRILQSEKCMMFNSTLPEMFACFCII